MLGVDRDSDICAELFDESDAAVLDAIGQIVGTARLPIDTPSMPIPTYSGSQCTTDGTLCHHPSM